MHKRINHNLNLTQILTVLGMLFAMLMAVKDFFVYKLSPFCDVSRLASCNLQSGYIKSSLFGIPISIWLLGIYLILFFSCRRLVGNKNHDSDSLKTMFFISLLGTILTFYLVLLEVSVLNILVSLTTAILFVLMAVIFIFTVRNAFYEHLVL